MPDLVVARLSGGLGNQLFQYAAACGVAQRTSGRIALDVTGYATATDGRRFALARYAPDAPVIDGTVINPSFRTARIAPQAALERLGVQHALQLPVRREDDYEFDPAVIALRGGNYLYGFWQSWKYFDDIADTLRGRLRRALHGAESPVGDDTVAVHVRRTDYLEPANLAAFGLCEPAYYRAALALMRTRIDHPRFLVFSDDPAWCARHLSDADVTIASPAGGDVHDDLARMAACRHHVLANSSLGWWGAWLGAAPGATVVAPIPWYTQSPAVADLLPASWLRLDRVSGAIWPTTAPDETLSVIVLAHTPATLARALANVRAQCPDDSQIIVALRDDWRGTPPTDGRVQATRASSAGDGAALNAALAQAAGDWIGFLDDRDVWQPDKLRIQRDAARLNGADAVVCRTLPIAGPNGMPMLFPPPGPPDCSLQDLVRAGHFIAGISHTIARRAALRALGDFEESWRVGAPSALWHRLMWHDRTVLLWQRLVQSPTPFLAEPTS